MPNNSSQTFYSTFLLLSGIALCLLQSGISGFIEIPGDLGDTRFNSYLLEYSYTWLTGSPLNNNFWNAPFYFPQSDVIAYSDTLLGVAPIYWICRFLGFGIPHSLLLWIALIGILNFVSSMALLRSLPGVSNIGASLGAFLFSFSSSRLSHFSHIQLLPQFYAILALLFLLKAFKSHSSAFLYLQIAAICFGLQCYSSFYLAWFTVFVFSLFFTLLLFKSANRDRLLAFVKTNAVAAGAAILTLGIITAPLAAKYLAASRTLGLRSPQEVLSFIPTLASLIYHGPNHFLYSEIYSSYNLLYGSHEHQFGFGLFSLLLALFGLLKIKDRTLKTAILSTIGICILLTIRLPHSPNSPWFYLSHWIPAAEAIRAVGRVHLVLLIFWSFGIATLVSQLPLRLKRKAALTCCIALFSVTLIAEQAREHTSYSWIQAQQPVDILKKAMIDAPDNCKTFFYASTGGKLSPWRYQLDMMWAGLLSQTTVVNGYSGNSPPDWGLYNAKINSEHDKLNLGKALTDWSQKHSLPAKNICWLLPAQQNALQAVDLETVFHK